MQKRALIIDGDQDAREYLAKIMKELGYEIDLHSKAEDALHTIAITDFTVVFTDSNLGEGKMDGITFARQLVTEMEQSDRPCPRIILMSGLFFSKDDIQNDLITFLMKPIFISELTRVLRA